MYSLDFEEFLGAKGFSESQIDDLFLHMKNLIPFSELELSVMFEHFRDYMVIGGMPAVVKKFVDKRIFLEFLNCKKIFC